MGSVMRSGKFAACLMFVCCEATVADEQHAFALPTLPQIRAWLSNDWYGDAARRAGLEGRVLLAFNITPDGRAKNPSVIWAEDTTLAANALEFLKSSRFKVPSHWGAEDRWRRWRLGVVFRLCPSSGQSAEFAIPEETVYVTGSRMTGAPVRTAPSAERPDTCRHPG